MVVVCPVECIAVTFDFPGFKAINVDADVEDKDKETAVAAPVYTSIKFTFTMDSLIVDLFTGGSKDVCSHNLFPLIFILCIFYLVFPFSFFLISYIECSISH
jgi:hypothetical protein